VEVLRRFAPQFAQSGKLVVVGFEDIDRIAAERNDLAQALTLAMDGVDNKDLNIMVVVTTNHMENVVGVLKRSGRFDRAMTIPLPDTAAIAELLQVYSGGCIDPSVDLTPYMRELVGVIPADIASIMDDAKISGIVREGKPTTVITEEDIEYAVACYMDRVEDEQALERKQEPQEIQQARVFGEALGQAISKNAQSLSFPIVIEDVERLAGAVMNGHGQHVLSEDDEAQFEEFQW